MFRKMFLLAAWLAFVCPAQGQESRKVPISFLPPPLETATYSLGIYDAKSGKLVRRLHEAATTSAFTVGDNGLITSWDGKDDAGKAVAPGRYAARGYAVGALKVEGEQILGNDWAADDENLRVKHVQTIALIPADNGVAVLARMADDTSALLRFSGEGKLLWRKPVDGLQGDAQPWISARAGHIAVLPRIPSHDGTEVVSVATFRDDGEASTEHGDIRVTVIEFPVKPRLDGLIQTAPPAGEFNPTVGDPGLSIKSGVGASKLTPERKTFPPIGSSETQRSPGKGDTYWNAAGLAGLVQTARDGTVLRKLEVTSGEPLPVAVSASETEDRLYLLEEKKGWQRVRGLSWLEAKEEDGKPVSTWQTVFEHSIRAPDPALGLDGPATPVELALVENPLTSDKAKVKLIATFDEKGSYLTTADGLRLRQISQRANLIAARVAKGKGAGGLTLYESDGAAWDEFSIEGAKDMMEFDAGEFDMTADGEKTHSEKPAEPPDL